MDPVSLVDKPWCHKLHVHANGDDLDTYHINQIKWTGEFWYLQYIPRNMHTVFALLCFVVVIHWPIFPYPSGLLHWHCGNLTIAPVPAKQPWWIWINTSCEFIMNDCITTTKQSTTKPCAYFLGYTVCLSPCRMMTIVTAVAFTCLPGVTNGKWDLTWLTKYLGRQKHRLCDRQLFECFYVKYMCIHPSTH